MEALKSLGRADLLEIARLAGVRQASRKTKRQLAAEISAWSLPDVRREALLCLARHLGLKNPQRDSKAALARRLAEHLEPATVDSLVESDRQAAAVQQINRAISGQLSGSAISSALASPPVQDVPQDLEAEQLRVTQTKFSPGIQHHLLIDKEARLPDQYGIDRAVLLLRDPFWLFLYWEITSETLARAAGLGYRESAIRLHDVTGLDPFGGRSRSHIDLRSGSSRSWYVSVPGDDRDYRAEVGCCNQQGEFLALLSSNSVSLPPARMSPRSDDRFATVPFDRSLRIDENRVGPTARSSAWYSKHAPDLHLRMARLSVPGATEASAGMVHAADVSETDLPISSGGSEMFRISFPWSSPALSKSEGSLWFQLGDDDHLTGEAEPGASVRVNGKSIPLDAQGKFSVHLTVPQKGRPMIAHSSTQRNHHEIIVQWKE